MTRENETHSLHPPRFYAATLSAGRVELSREESHHASHVLRMKVGGRIELFDGAGAIAQAEIVEVAKRGVVIAVGEIQRLERPDPQVHLACATPKGNRLDWLLEKATELGAASIRPIIFQRSVACGELSDHKRDRWTGHCVSAAKQCRLNFLPELLPTMKFADFIAAGGDYLGLTGDLEQSSSSFGEVLSHRRARQAITILIGPEGDFAPQERAAAVSAGFKSVRLGHTTLRVETAAIALLSAVNAWA